MICSSLNRLLRIVRPLSQSEQVRSAYILRRSEVVSALSRVVRLDRFARVWG